MWYSVYQADQPGEPDYVHTFSDLQDALDEMASWLFEPGTGLEYNPGVEQKFTLEVHTDGDKYIEMGR